jgi:ATP-dependent helicase/nuclease subunit A
VSAWLPDAALRERDAHARRAAQTVFDRPLVLAAGAGTGKTATLVARIVSWCLGVGWERAVAEERAVLASGEEPAAERVAARVLDGVVAITFTEAAAAEMAARVGDTLRGLIAGRPPAWLAREVGPPDERERANRGRALVVALDHLTASTIHAFCRRLLARYPLAAGLHPSFAVDADEAQLQEVVREVVASALPVLLGSRAAADALALVVDG